MVGVITYYFLSESGLSGFTDLQDWDFSHGRCCLRPLFCLTVPQTKLGEQDPSAGHEIDLLILGDDKIKIVEIKATETIMGDLFKGLHYFENLL